MFFSDIPLAFLIVAFAGGISCLALLFSRLLDVSVSRSYIGNNGVKSDAYDLPKKYECGFPGEVPPNFSYITDKHFAISVYLILELAILCLLVCFAFHVADNGWYGDYFIKLLLSLILITILISSKVCFPKK